MTIGSRATVHMRMSSLQASSMRNSSMRSSHWGRNTSTCSSRLVVRPGRGPPLLNHGR